MDEYLNEMKANGKSASTIKNTRIALQKLNAFKPLAEITKNDLVKYFSNFKTTEEGMLLHKGKVKKYYTDIGKSNLVDWLKLKKPKGTLKFDDILTSDDINKMIESTDGLYWKALIAFLFESGARIGEVESLKFKDFKETNLGMIVDIPTHKTSADFRRIPLLLSAQFIRNYKTYSTKTENDIVFDLKHSWTTQQLQAIAHNAGITKPVSAHKFRHAQATIMVQQGVQESIIRKKHGWSPTSTAISKYQHLNDNSVVEAITGKKTEIIPIDIKQPEKMTIVDTSVIISRLMEERDQQDKKIALLMEKLEQQEKGIKTKFAEIEEKMKVTHTKKKIPGKADFHIEEIQFPQSKPKVNEIIIEEKIVEEEPLSEEMILIKENMSEDDFKKFKESIDFKKMMKKGDKMK